MVKQRKECQQPQHLLVGLWWKTALEHLVTECVKAACITSRPSRVLKSRGV